MAKKDTPSLSAERWHRYDKPETTEKDWEYSPDDFDASEDFLWARSDSHSDGFLDSPDQWAEDQHVPYGDTGGKFDEEMIEGQMDLDDAAEEFLRAHEENDDVALEELEDYLMSRSGMGYATMDYEGMAMYGHTTEMARQRREKADLRYNWDYTWQLRGDRKRQARAKKRAQVDGSYNERYVKPEIERQRKLRQGPQGDVYRANRAAYMKDYRAKKRAEAATEALREHYLMEAEMRGLDCLVPEAGSGAVVDMFTDAV